MPPALRIGTRGSPLAVVQAEAVRAALQAAGAARGERVAGHIHKISTIGDRVTDRPLTEIGGKGLFTKEIDRALREGEVDCAVHSMKDMESHLAPGLVIAAVMARSDPRDCLVGAKGFAALPQGARLGTSAQRRKAQALGMRPDLQIIPLRGNVGTRLAKYERGEADAIVLAKAGLDRLGKADVISYVFEPSEMLPDPGQGIIAIVAREGDETMSLLLSPIDHAETHVAACAERAFSAALDGSCRSPIAAFAIVSAGRVRLDGAAFTPDGREAVRGHIEGAVQEAEILGRRLAEDLRARASPAILAVLDKE